MEAWHAEKTREKVLGPWIRSRRPPPVPLGTGLAAVFQIAGEGVTSVALSPDGNFIAAGCADGGVRVLSAELGVQLNLLTGHSGHVTAVAFSPDGCHLFGSSKDAMILWDVASGVRLGQLGDLRGGISSLLWHHDGTLIAVADSNYVTVYRLQLGQTRKEGDALHLVDAKPLRSNTSAGAWRELIPDWDGLLWWCGDKWREILGVVESQERQRFAGEIRILFRVWQTRVPFDCDRYITQLQQRCPEITPYLEQQK